MSRAGVMQRLRSRLVSQVPRNSSREQAKVYI